MIQQNVSLTGFNTFNLPCVAERYLALTNLRQLEDAAFEQAPELVLGGGSNMLLLDYVPGLTVHVALGGIRVIDESPPQKITPAETDFSLPPVTVRVAAGVDWNQFVRYTLDRGWYGFENLILIPGTVGAAPVQNIGAYGAEVAERIEAVHVWEYGVGPRVLRPEECEFGYRDSRFKREPGRFLITAVDLRLNGEHELKTGYGAIQAELARLNVKTPNPNDVALAVTNIRRSKLPDWFFLGNSGSFFKNPVVPQSVHSRLKAEYDDLPSYPIDEGHVKLPAGWLIDRAGLKGKRDGAAGTYAKQALVMVNHGGATGQEVLSFSEHVQAEVRAKFGVALEREVRLQGVKINNISMAKSSIYPALVQTVQRFQQDTDASPPERAVHLQRLADLIEESSQAKETLPVNFVCTHNSRRSQIAQVWTAVAAAWYGNSFVQAYSGGTEVTALHPNVVTALISLGFRVEDKDQNRHLIYFSDAHPPVEGWSKRYDDPANPSTDFVAVMVCNDADTNCPFLPSAKERLAIKYTDPKFSDGSPEEAATYLQTAETIGAEVFSLFRRLQSS
jgi:UDP-N-acetylmuramate dehydrogenase